MALFSGLSDIMMTYIFCFKKLFACINLIYSSLALESLKSSKENFKSLVIYLITFFQCIYFLLKTLVDNSFHPF